MVRSQALSANNQQQSDTTQYQSFYPVRFQPAVRPTIFTQITSTIHTYEQELLVGPSNVGLRMVTIKLQNGNFVVYSPAAPTPECLDMVRKVMGPRIKSSQIIFILPGSAEEHTAWAMDWAKLYPGAQMWAMPAVDEKRLGTRVTSRLQNRSCPCELGGEFDVITVENPLFNDSIMRHRPTGTMLVADILTQVQDKKYCPSELQANFLKFFGTWELDLFPLIKFGVRLWPGQFPEIAKEVLSWRVTRMIGVHGDSPLSGAYLERRLEATFGALAAKAM